MGQEQQPNTIPVQAVDIDKLPREKGFTYDEIAKIVGSLYLDSHHRFNIMEEQLQAIMRETRSQAEYAVGQLTEQCATLQSEIDKLTSENLALRQELERRNERRPSSPAVPNRSSENSL